MAKKPLTFTDYLKAAFFRRGRVPLLGHMPFNQMALAGFAVLGLANPGFWLLGAGIELAYLFGLSSSARFQKLVQGEKLQQVQTGWNERILRVVARLDPEGRRRYQRLMSQVHQALGISAALDGSEIGNLRHLRTRGINQLIWIFLRLLTSRQIIAETLTHLDRAKLDEEIRDLEERLTGAEPDGALARSLTGTLEIQKKRLGNLDRAQRDLTVIDAELRRIEQQVELIREESAVTGKPEFLSGRLDQVTSTMSETSRWMDQHSDFFSSLEGASSDGLLSDLPEMPPEMGMEKE